MNITWDEYFMGIAQLSARRSKDPCTKVGACIVSRDNRIKSCGYNGFPQTIKDNDKTLSWKKDGDWLDTKYPYVVHAELNAILNTKQPLNDCIMYVTLFPCNECAKAIIQTGITEVVYLSDEKHDKKEIIAARELLDLAGIRYRKYTGRELNIRFN